ncbi:MAG TPA: phosphoenolpyruvate synthase [Gammaproteobacteria bacterium]|nr:phosphoenolpyruvate synthase [Gammaproteobacteria bacterium]
MKRVIGLEDVGNADVAIVGGKNASLGEMINQLSATGVNVPEGFATTAEAYREFLADNNLDTKINQSLQDLDVDDVNALELAGNEIRGWLIDAPLGQRLQKEIGVSYRQMERQFGSNVAVAVRSSATAEDLPEASFAGQQDTFLNIRGIGNVLSAVHHVFASLFNNRAIAYRVHQGFDHAAVALSAGVQRMIRSDIGSAGVIFTLDTESGFSDAVFITGAWGLGETVVQGAVNPDEFFVYKPTLTAGQQAILSRSLGEKAIKMIFTDTSEQGKSLRTVEVEDSDRRRFCITDKQVEALARHAVSIEQHYGRPMDIEWALDGVDGELYIVQARPETVRSGEQGAAVIERYHLRQKGPVLITGRAIGRRIGSGIGRVVLDPSKMEDVQTGDVLVTDMTDPDWEPIMKRASAIVTNRGGRTCHAAIIARELDIPAIVGCGDATGSIHDGQELTVCCAEGDTGSVYEGKLAFEVERHEVDSLPDLPVKLMMNVGNPTRAFDFSRVPNQGVGLARLEFIINAMIGIHPQALLGYSHLEEGLQRQIAEKIAGYDGPVEFYIKKLKEGIATIAAAFAPQPVIVRLSDFKSNEYINLLGGELYEPDEENPMIGYRGTTRYLSPQFRESFAMECQALKSVRDDMGLFNVQVMVPFVRTLDEASAIIDLLAENGLRRGENGLKILMMCELPSNAVMAEEFLQYFDGFSIGSNDLTQLTLGLDRDSGLVAHLFDERDPAIRKMLLMAIKACLKHNKYIGICGQGPSDYPEFAAWLVEQGISSLSLNPDTVIETWLDIARRQESGGKGKEEKGKEGQNL